MTVQKDNFFRKNRYSFLWVVGFILIVLLHISGLFYSEPVSAVESSDSYKPAYIALPVMALCWVVQRFKLLGSS